MVRWLTLLVVIATDETGLATSKTISRTVGKSLPNRAPAITSEPNPEAEVGLEWTYVPVATDPDQDAVQWQVVEPSIPVTFDATQGQISFTPNPAQIGETVQITLQATDVPKPGATPLKAQQSMQVRIRPRNVPTELATIAPQTALAGGRFFYNVEALDANHDELTFSLLQGMYPTGMQIDARTGRIQWNVPAVPPDQPIPPASNVRVAVSDGRLQATADFTIQIQRDSAAPSVSIVVESELAKVGETVSIRVDARDDSGRATASLRLGRIRNGNTTRVLNQELNLDRESRARLPITQDMVGTLEFTAEARDAAGHVTVANPAELRVIDPNDTHAPQVQILFPLTGVVTEPTPVFGNVEDNLPDSLSWKLYLYDRANNQERPLSQGTGAVTKDRQLALLDPTTLKNGQYWLTLEATDAAGTTTTDVKVIEIKGALKLGQLRLSFKDMEVNVGGIPLAITRTYDSLNANVLGDFGYGWSLDIANFKLGIERNGPRIRKLSQLDPFTAGTRVTIQLPDGSSHGFTFAPEPIKAEGRTIMPPLTGMGPFSLPKFVPDLGNTSTLEVEPISIVSLNGNDGYNVANLEDTFHGYNPADKMYTDGLFRLKLRNGTTFVLDALTGALREIRQSDGHVITLDDKGIFSNFKRGIILERDSANRIKAAVDPQGKRVEYTYDEQTRDLIQVKDRAGTVTKLGYSTERPHFLTTILDQNDQKLASATYDESGRIKQLTDAANSASTITYDSINRQQTVIDALGNVTKETFDKWGNIVRSVDPTGVTVLRTFDDDSLLLSETLVIGKEDATSGETDDLTIRYEYKNGNRVKTTTPRGLVSQQTYNLAGQLEASTDVFNRVTVRSYWTDGMPSSVTDPYGNMSFFTFMEGGLLRRVRNNAHVDVVVNDFNVWGDVVESTFANGQVVHFTYDQNGDKIATWRFETRDDDTWALVDNTDFDDARRPIQTSHYQIPQSEFNNDLRLLPAVLKPEHLRTTTTTQYGFNGKVISSKDEQGLSTEYTYSRAGQVLQTRREVLDSAGNRSWLNIRTIYDKLNRPILQTASFLDGAGAVAATATEYDAAGRVTVTRELRDVLVDISGPREGATTVLTRTGHVLSTNTTAYDSAGRVLGTTQVNCHNAPPAQGDSDAALQCEADDNDVRVLRTRTIYNAFGEVTETRREVHASETTKVWLATRTMYDAFGRALFTTSEFEVAGNDFTANSPAVDASETVYDQHNRAAIQHRRQGVIVGIDATGNTQVVNPGDIVLTTQSVYNAKGQLAESIDDDGNVTRYEYDNQGRQVAVESPSQLASDVGLSAAPGTRVALRTETVYGRPGVSNVTRSNILVYTAPDGTRTKDDSRAIESSSDTDIEGRTVAAHTTFKANGKTLTTRFEYDARGNQIAEVDPLSNRKTFTYDAVGRLTSVKLPGVRDPADGLVKTPEYQYAYDVHGNQTLLRDPLGRETHFLFDAQGRPTGRILPLGYRADGRQDSPLESVDAAFHESTHYDDRGRTSLEVSFEGVHTQYVYSDTTGRLLAKQFYASAADYTANRVAERWEFTYDAYGRETLFTKR